jgi:hypothetical protein
MMHAPYDPLSFGTAGDRRAYSSLGLLTGTSDRLG